MQTLTRLERLDNDKQSSLSRTFVNYGRKKFYTIGPWWQHVFASFIEQINRKTIITQQELRLERN
jgi:hypothetical protein